MSKEKYIKSPLNYTGGKYKLLPKILPLFPKNINTFVDLFCGGCNVSVNVEANKYICNDLENHVIDLYRLFKNVSSEDVIDGVNEIIDKYELSNTSKYGYEYYNCDSSKGVSSYNKTKYELLRSDYNKDTSNNLMFFTTVIFAFNNQIRFNSKGEFNMPCNKRDFNKNVQKNTIEFVDSLDDRYGFTCKDFREVDLDSLGSNDFAYLDPPYLITTATYNENGGWTEKDEIDLLELLDKLNERGVKFALSNVVTHKGKVNNILLDWINRNNYSVEHLGNNYKNCNYHDLTGINGDSDEVLVMNY